MFLCCSDGKNPVMVLALVSVLVLHHSWFSLEVRSRCQGCWRITNRYLVSLRSWGGESTFYTGGNHLLKISFRNLNKEKKGIWPLCSYWSAWLSANILLFNVILACTVLWHSCSQLDEIPETLDSLVKVDLTCFEVSFVGFWSLLSLENCHWEDPIAPCHLLYFTGCCHGSPTLFSLLGLVPCPLLPWVPGKDA